MTDSANSTYAPSRQKLNGAAPPPRPRRKPLRINRQRRERMEEIVDGLLRLLDEVDGDSDEEPSTTADAWPGIPSGALDECEDNHDAEPDEDGEPCLGWTATTNQTSFGWRGEPHANLWAWGIMPVADGEEEHDGREPDEDREPSLGSLENHASTAGFFMGRDGRGSQVHWADGRSDDREDDGDEGDYSGYAGERVHQPALRVRTFGVVENGVVTVESRKVLP